jgi:hypothetical protein
MQATERSRVMIQFFGTDGLTTTPICRSTKNGESPFSSWADQLTTHLAWVVKSTTQALRQPV